MHPSRRHAWSQRPTHALLVATALFVLLGNRCTSHRDVTFECPASVRVGEVFLTSAGSTEFDFTSVIIDWETRGPGRARTCLYADVAECLASGDGDHRVDGIEDTWDGDFNVMRWIATDSGELTIRRTAEELVVTEGCSGPGRGGVETDVSCTIEILPVSGDDDDDDTTGDDDDTTGDDDDDDDDDDSTPLPPGWSGAGGFGDGLFPNTPAVAVVTDFVFVAVLEDESPDNGERDDHRTMAPLRRGPDWDVVPGDGVQGANEYATRTLLAPGAAGSLWLARGWLSVNGTTRFSIDRLEAGATSMDQLNASAVTTSGLGGSPALAVSAAGVPHLAWIDGGVDRTLSIAALEGEGATGAPVWVGGSIQSVALVAADAVYAITMAGQWQTGTDIVVYGPTKWSTFDYLGQLDNPEQGWNVGEVTATVTPDGDVVAVFGEVPPSASGLPPGLRAVRWTPGTDPSTATDLGISGSLGMASYQQVVSGPDGTLWYAAILQSDASFVLYRLPPGGAAWEAVTAPDAPGDVDGFALVADPDTVGLLTVARSWRGGGNGSGIEVLRYQVP